MHSVWSMFTEFTNNPALFQCADHCSPKEYIEELHRYSWMGLVTSIPFRIKYFCSRKLTVFQIWLAPPDLYDPNSGFNFIYYYPLK